MRVSFLAHWSGLLGNKPALADDDIKIELTARELKRLCSQFYDRGTKDTAEVARILRGQNRWVLDDLFGEFAL